MAVIKKSPGAALFLKRVNGNYELRQGFAGLGSTKVLAAPCRSAGWPGVWSAKEIGPEGHHGKEHHINRNLAVPIGGGDVHRFSTFLTEPISGMLGIEDRLSLPWIARLAIGFAGAAVIATLLSKRMTANSPVVRREIDDTSWAIYWRQPGTDVADATYIGMVIDQEREGYPFYAQAVNGANGTHQTLEDAEKWLVTRTWRVFPGGKR